MCERSWLLHPPVDPTVCKSLCLPYDLCGHYSCFLGPFHYLLVSQRSEDQEGRYPSKFLVACTCHPHCDSRCSHLGPPGARRSSAAAKEPCIILLLNPDIWYRGCG